MTDNADELLEIVELARKRHRLNSAFLKNIGWKASTGNRGWKVGEGNRGWKKGLGNRGKGWPGGGRGRVSSTGVPLAPGDREVRTPEGARYFGQPIGTIIKADEVKKVRAQRKMKLAEFKAQQSSSKSADVPGATPAEARPTKPRIARDYSQESKDKTQRAANAAKIAAAQIKSSSANSSGGSSPKPAGPRPLFERAPGTYAPIASNGDHHVVDGDNVYAVTKGSKAYKGSGEALYVVPMGDFKRTRMIMPEGEYIFSNPEDKKRITDVLEKAAKDGRLKNLDVTPGVPKKARDQAKARRKANSEAPSESSSDTEIPDVPEKTTARAAAKARSAAKSMASDAREDAKPGKAAKSSKSADTESPASDNPDAKSAEGVIGDPNPDFPEAPERIPSGVYGPKSANAKTRLRIFEDGTGELDDGKGKVKFLTPEQAYTRYHGTGNRSLSTRHGDNQGKTAPSLSEKDVKNAPDSPSVEKVQPAPKKVTKAKVESLRKAQEKKASGKKPTSTEPAPTDATPTSDLDKTHPGSELRDADGDPQFRRTDDGMWESAYFGTKVSDEDIRDLYDSGDLSVSSVRKAELPETATKQERLDVIDNAVAGDKVVINDRAVTKAEDGSWMLDDGSGKKISPALLAASASNTAMEVRGAPDSAVKSAAKKADTTGAPENTTKKVDVPERTFTPVDRVPGETSRANVEEDDQFEAESRFMAEAFPAKGNPGFANVVTRPVDTSKDENGNEEMVSIEDLPKPAPDAETALDALKEVNDAAIPAVATKPIRRGDPVSADFLLEAGTGSRVKVGDSTFEKREDGLWFDTKHPEAPGDAAALAELASVYGSRVEKIGKRKKPAGASEKKKPAAKEETPKKDTTTDVTPDEKSVVKEDTPKKGATPDEKPVAKDVTPDEKPADKEEAAPVRDAPVEAVDDTDKVVQTAEVEPTATVKRDDGSVEEVSTEDLPDHSPDPETVADALKTANDEAIPVTSDKGRVDGAQITAESVLEAEPGDQIEMADGAVFEMREDGKWFDVEKPSAVGGAIEIGAYSAAVGGGKFKRVGHVPEKAQPDSTSSDVVENVSPDNAPDLTSSVPGASTRMDVSELDFYDALPTSVKKKVDSGRSFVILQNSERSVEAKGADEEFLIWDYNARELNRVRVGDEPNASWMEYAPTGSQIVLNDPEYIADLRAYGDDGFPAVWTKRADGTWRSYRGKDFEFPNDPRETDYATMHSYSPVVKRIGSGKKPVSFPEEFSSKFSKLSSEDRIEYSKVATSAKKTDAPSTKNDGKPSVPSKAPDVETAPVPDPKVPSSKTPAKKADSGEITAQKVTEGAITAKKVTEGAITAKKVTSGENTAKKVEKKVPGVPTRPDGTPARNLAETKPGKYIANDLSGPNVAKVGDMTLNVPGSAQVFTHGNDTGTAYVYTPASGNLTVITKDGAFKFDNSDDRLDFKNAFLKAVNAGKFNRVDVEKSDKAKAASAKKIAEQEAKDAAEKAKIDEHVKSVKVGDTPSNTWLNHAPEGSTLEMVETVSSGADKVDVSRSFTRVGNGWEDEDGRIFEAADIESLSKPKSVKAKVSSVGPAAKKPAAPAKPASSKKPETPAKSETPAKTESAPQDPAPSADVKPKAPVTKPSQSAKATEDALYYRRYRDSEVFWDEELGDTVGEESGLRQRDTQSIEERANVLFDKSQAGRGLGARNNGRNKNFEARITSSYEDGLYDESNPEMKKHYDSVKDMSPAEFDEAVKEASNEYLTLLLNIPKKRDMQKYDEHMARMKAASERVTAYDQAFLDRGRWTRSWITPGSDGHIHSSRECSTCYVDTDFEVVPVLSGLSQEDVAKYAGRLACTTCYPDAPTSKAPGKGLQHSADAADEAAKAERAAQKAQREVEKMEKGITSPDGTPLQVGDKWGDHKYPTTLRTEYAARQEMNDRIIDAVEPVQLGPNPGEEEWWNPESVQRNFDMRDRVGASTDTILEALAHKHGTTPEEQMPEILLRLQKKDKGLHFRRLKDDGIPGSKYDWQKAAREFDPEKVIAARKPVASEHTPIHEINPGVYAAPSAGARARLYVYDDKTGEYVDGKGNRKHLSPEDVEKNFNAGKNGMKRVVKSDSPGQTSPSAPVSSEVPRRILDELSGLPGSEYPVLPYILDPARMDFDADQNPIYPPDREIAADFFSKSGGVLAHDYERMSAMHLRDWVDAAKRGDWAAAYEIEKKAARLGRGETWEKATSHPGHPNNKGTHDLPWLRNGATKVPLGRHPAGEWSTLPVDMWSPEEVDNFILALGYEDGDHIQSWSRREFVEAHLDGDARAIDVLLHNANYSTYEDYIKPHDNVKITKASTVVHASGDYPTVTDPGIAKAYIDEMSRKDKTIALLKGMSPKEQVDGLNSVFFQRRQDYYARNPKEDLRPARESVGIDGVNRTSVMKNSAGEAFIVKLPSDEPSDETQRFLVENEHVANSIGRDSGFELADTFLFDVPGQGVSVAQRRFDDIQGTLGQVVLGDENAPDYTGELDLDKLTESQAEQMLALHPLDIILDNYDAHFDNFLVGSDGRIIPIDKGYAWQDLGDYDPYAIFEDVPGSEYLGNMAVLGIYDGIISGHYSTEQVNRFRSAAVEAARRIQAMDEKKLMERLTGLFDQRSDKGGRTTEEMVQAVLDRKRSLVSGVEAMWDGISARRNRV